ncbi:TPA: hypothetical protein ACGYPU_001173 [Streptococcus pyogenes]|uniref:hypothetical protein n=1 Tax=Streptococcus pyogenes TaxID=1314 RepID=UPI000DA2C1AB|nr:hypothetical protein [Streptococcus pyogenes]SQH09628.1 Uncharacterised protein [Streptococcus pyogenes]VHG14266.1 membrane protein [Streptococcus pyogenes]HEP1290482.1 hypothetical protein [Streptococcus pyogenes]HEP1293389.1 hypothetical protein [Streptococcus pyogenes]HEQ2794104.1 hypothetical protein [Streptococcus pyogenes]
MINKNYFMKTFNLILWLLMMSPVCWVFNYIALQLNTITLLELGSLENKASQMSFFAYSFAVLTLVSALILAGVEIVERLKEDNLWNYVKAIYQTFSLRNFLFQREKVQKISNLEHQTVTTTNPVHNGFNRAVRKCVVDIRLDSVTVFIKVPKDQQGQKILKDMEAQLKEEIASQHTEYYFSSPIRVRNQLWFIGKKR